MYRKIPTANKSIFISWLFSYFSIMLVPVLISAVVYSFSLKVIKNETNRANMALLTQLQQTIDKELDKLKKTALQASINNRVKEALRIKGSFEKTDLYNIYELQKDLYSIQSTNQFLNYIYIFFRDNEMAVSRECGLDADQFYTIESREIILGKDEWKELMHKDYSDAYMVFNGLNEEGENVRSIAYLQTIPLTGRTNNVGTLVLMVKVNTILKTIREISWLHNGIVLILDDTNQIVASTQPILINENLNYETFANEKDIVYTRTTDTEYAVCYVTSGKNTWKYIMMMPTNVFWEQAAYLRNVIYSALVLCIVLGGVAAFVFTKKNYNPMHKLVQALANGDVADLDSKYKEFDFIKDVVSNVLNEKKALAKTLDEKDNALSNSILVRLLSTNTGLDKNAIEILASHGADPENGRFLVILFQMDEYYATDETELTKYVISSVVEEIVNMKYIGLMADMGDNMLACIVNIKERDNSIRDMFPVLNNIRQLIGMKLNIQLNVSTGNVHKGAREIARSCKEAFEALQAQSFLNKDGIITYDEITSLNENYHYSLNIENKLLNLVKAGEFENAYTLLDEILEKSSGDEEFSIDTAKCMMFDIVGTLLKISNTIEYKEFMKHAQPYMRLTDCASLEDMKSEIKSMFGILCNFAVKNTVEAVDNRLSKKVDAFIEGNYSNVNLGLQMIADHFGLTPMYVSKVYKNQTGKKIVDRIKEIRIEKSKQMLITEKKIKDISEMVGFVNSSVFIKIFKEYEGITPGNYRRHLEGV